MEEKERRNLSDQDNTTSGVNQPTRNRPHCKVLLLDGECVIIPVDKKAKAQVVINELFRHLELKDLQEKEYFSVYYVDAASDCKIFLNPFKQIRKQLPNASGRTVWEFFFGVQFYATQIDMLGDEVTRYLYVLQICRDIKERRINADHSTKLQLVSLLVQANCGDHDPTEHGDGYVDPYVDLIYNQAEIPVGLSNSVIEMHKEKTGFNPSEADNSFFMIAKNLYRFGQQVFPVHDRLGQSGHIGASLVGLFFHKDGKEFMNIEWQDVVTVGYRRKKLRIKYHPKGSNDEKEEVLYLRCTDPSAKLVWRGCVEQHTFFRLERPKPLVDHSIKSWYSFNRKSEFYFSRSRTLYQMQRAERRQPQNFQRSLSLRLSGRSLPDRQSRRNETIRDKEPSPIGLPDRSSNRNETLYKKESSTSMPHIKDGPKQDEPDNRERSLEPERPQSVPLQQKIEEALKEKRSEINLVVDVEPTKPEATTVEMCQPDDDKKSEAEEEPRDDLDDQSLEVKVEHTTTDIDIVIEAEQEPEQLHDTLEFNVLQNQAGEDNDSGEDDEKDEANVEFSAAEKRLSSFVVTLEETDDVDEPELPEAAIAFEGKYRSDSIVTNDLGPVAQYILEKSNPQDGTVTATAVDIEVRTPTPNYDLGTIQEAVEIIKVETASGKEVEIINGHSPTSDNSDI